MGNIIRFFFLTVPLAKIARAYKKSVSQYPKYRFEITKICIFSPAWHIDEVRYFYIDFRENAPTGSKIITKFGFSDFKLV